MKFLKPFTTKIGSEIDQKKILQKNLLLNILSSKRLLVDHVEMVETSLNDVLGKGEPTTDVITLLGTSSVLATSCVIFFYCKQNLRYLVPCVSCVVPVLYTQKLVNIKKRECVESKLSKFIKSLDSFESAIKKNRTFLHEAQMIKTASSILKRYDKENQMPLNLVTSIKSVVRALYKLVKDLESIAIIQKWRSIYDTFEDIEDCALMKKELAGDIDLKIIKDFFNVFAYIQSQVLLRFVLIAVSDVEESKKVLNNEIGELTELIINETGNISKFLELINDVSQQQANIKMQIDREISMTMPRELRQVRTGSITFSAKILAVAMRCQQLEELIVKFAENFEHPDNKDVDEIMAVMKNVENEMAQSIEEHKRIEISFQKYLNMEIEDDKISQETLDGAASDNVVIVKSITDSSSAQSDDFFFVEADTEAIADEAKVQPADEAKAQPAESMDEVDLRLAKQYFKPVLDQLKIQIKGIGEDMKEREKKVLKAKGIEIQDEPVVPENPAQCDDDGSGSDDERERQRKIKKSQQKFDENREFLESKQPVNIFAGGLPRGFPSAPADDEDILESQ